MNQATVRDFAAYMCSHFGATLVDKRSAIEMLLLSWALTRLGIAPSGFLDRYATTIGHRVYLPFTPGQSATWTLWDQVQTITHECQHVVQYDQQGPLTFAAKYARGATRAIVEADAYRCALELHHWKTGQILDCRALASTLSAYACTPTDQAVAEKLLRMSAITVKAGGVINRASRVAIDWLKAHAPEVREIP